MHCYLWFGPKRLSSTDIATHLASLRRFSPVRCAKNFATDCFQSNACNAISYSSIINKSECYCDLVARIVAAAAGWWQFVWIAVFVIVFVVTTISAISIKFALMTEIQHTQQKDIAKIRKICCLLSARHKDLYCQSESFVACNGCINALPRCIFEESK